MRMGAAGDHRVWVMVIVKPQLENRIFQWEADLREQQQAE